MDLEDFDNGTAYAHYRSFGVGLLSVDPEEDGYPLTVADYSGTAGRAPAAGGAAAHQPPRWEDTEVLQARLPPPLLPAPRVPAAVLPVQILGCGPRRPAERGAPALGAGSSSEAEAREQGRACAEGQPGGPCMDTACKRGARVDVCARACQGRIVPAGP